MHGLERVVYQKPGPHRAKSVVLYPNGVFIQEEGAEKHHAGTTECYDERTFFLVIRRLLNTYQPHDLGLLKMWCILAAVLQISVLILLAFEAPGYEDRVWVNASHVVNGTRVYRMEPRHVLRFISDNIDLHRGYGALMVVFFGMSYLPMMICTFRRSVYNVLMRSMLFTACVGGFLVVTCHSADKDIISWLHIAGAISFVVSGLVLHVILMSELTSMRLHIARDCTVLIIIVCLALTFAITLMLARSNEWTKSSHRIVFQVSAAAEYMLYISCVGLNVLVGERITEHLALRITETLIKSD